ncbi:MAG: SixA phosphatase family protein [Thermoplasmata archaeon]
MTVYLFRHGPAEERDPQRWPDDARRPLTRAGIEETEAAARGLRSLEPPVARILTSPAERASATAEIVRSTLGVGSPVSTWPELAPDEPASGVLARLAGEPPRRDVLLVGHEPTLGELTGLALTGEGVSIVRLTRAGAAAIDFARKVAPGAGALDWLLTRRQLIRLGR